MAFHVNNAFVEYFQSDHEQMYLCTVQYVARLSLHSDMYLSCLANSFWGLSWCVLVVLKVGNVEVQHNGSRTLEKLAFLISCALFQY